MLHLETVEPRTFAILKKLMSIPVLKDFSLVGGTALSLVYGHRISVDLDVFSNEKFENNHISSVLSSVFHEQFIYEPSKNAFFGIFCFIENVKVDIVHFSHSRISDIVTVDGIRMYGIPDIAAMKIQAILGRGKKKDFWDLAEILTHYSLEQVIAWHKEKYPSQMLAISIPGAITYFEDADDSEDPVSLKGQTWESVKTVINKSVSEYLS